MRAGLDIGGTKIDAVILDEGSRIRGRYRCPTGRGNDEVFSHALEALRFAAEAAGVRPGDLDGVGIGVPGAVDAEHGLVSNAVNLGIERLPLGVLLNEELGISVTMENDVNAAALGTWELLQRSGVTPAPRSVALLNLGTGVAAGIVEDGHLRTGARGMAGEIGHIPVMCNNRLCRCGQIGCLETVCSGWAIDELWPATVGFSSEALMVAARNGDHVAGQIWKDLIEGVAHALRLLSLTVDPDVIVIGGGQASLGSTLMEDVRRVLASWRKSTHLYDSLLEVDVVRLQSPGSPAAAIGAALVSGR